MIRSKRLTLLFTFGTVATCLWTSCAPGPAPSTPTPGSSSSSPARLVGTGGNRKDNLRTRIEFAINNVRERDLETTNGFWTVFHGILGLGLSVTLQNPETGSKVVAIDYIANGGTVRGLEFIQTKDGLDVETGRTQWVSQGHQDQFIAEMAQWGIAADKKFLVNGREYTYMDFVRHSQMRARVAANQELSWAIVVIGQYIGTDLTWTNSAGEKLRYEDLIRYELDQSIESPMTACGGTHRLFGLTWSYYLHLRNGGKTEGVWKDVVEKTRKYQQIAKKYQNPDGSFSTNYFRGTGNAPEMQQRISTTGHTLEWLALSLTDAQLREPWVQEAVNALSLMFADIQGQEMESGALYHAVHGLLLYYARVYDAAKLGANEPYIPLPPSGTLVSKAK